MDLRGLLLHPDLEPSLAREAAALDAAAAWRGAVPRPGGRETVRHLALAGRELLLKREARGGLAGRLLPDRYLRLEPFRREWALSRWLDARRMTPPLWARWFVARGACTEVYTLIEPLAGAVSLAEAVRSGRAREEELLRAGDCVGRLHGQGVLHGDLNAGNLLLSPSGAWAIDWRHSSREERLGAARRRRNLDRLARSLVKVAGAGQTPGRQVWASLAEGYAQGFGSREPWLERWVEGAGRVCPLRRWLWRAAR